MKFIEPPPNVSFTCRPCCSVGSLPLLSIYAAAVALARLVAVWRSGYSEDDSRHRQSSMER